MLISKESATRIVKELQDIIHQNLNLIDENGFIFASTDKSRVGQFHEAAYRLVKNKLPVMVVNQDNEFEGAKKGINLPLELNNEIVGVIGITGEAEEVSKYGQIIKKITEIMMYNLYIREQMFWEERMRERFVHELIFGNISADDPSIENKGKMLGIDLDVPRVVAIAKIVDYPGKGDRNFVPGNTDDQVFKFIKNEIKDHKNNILISMGDKYILYLASDNPMTVKKEIGRIAEKLYNAISISIVFGIGNVCYSYTEANISYKEALNALNVAVSEGITKCYSEIDIELIFGEVSQRVKKEFIDKIFKNCTPEEIKEIIETLEVFFANNGSIGKCAQQMFIHKNTMQYRISKIAKKTGYDPRNIKEGAVLYLAAALYNYIK